MARILKSVIATFLLTAILVFFLIIIISPLLAQQKYAQAVQYLSEKNYIKAAVSAREALRLDPLNADHQVLLADIYTNLAYRSDPFYENAISLDPLNAEYWLKRGVARIKLERGHKAGAVHDAIGYFRNAVSLDPKGFNVSYQAGYSGIVIWRYLSGSEKDFILSRLKFATALQPEYAKQIYPKLWQASYSLRVMQRATPDTLISNQTLYNFLFKNNLWLVLKAQRKAVDDYMTRESSVDGGTRTKEKDERIEKVRRNAAILSGNSKWLAQHSIGTPEGGFILPASELNGKNINGRMATFGNMYSTGTIDGALYLSTGKADIVVRAKSTPASGVYPYMIVELDGVEIGDAYIDTKEWKNYAFSVIANEGIHVISITFTNDGWDVVQKEDRNLFISDVRALPVGAIPKEGTL